MRRLEDDETLLPPGGEDVPPRRVASPAREVSPTPDPPPSPGLPAPPPPAHGRRDELRAYAVTVLGTLVLLVPVLRLLDVDLTAPLSYAQDGVSHMAIAKAVQENPWYYENPRLGAPFGQQLYDYPQADTLHIALLKVLGPLAGGNPALTVNLAYLLGFVLIALTTHLALRRLGVRTAFASAGALLYAFTPYHLQRGTTHLFLSGYFVLPLALLAVVTQLGDRPAFTHRDGERLRWSFDGTSVLALAACLLLTTTGVYYAIFTALLLGVVLLVQLARRVDGRALASTLTLITGIGAGLVLAVLPTLSYRAANGPNPLAANRAYIEVEFFALKPVALVLPIAEHRLEALRSFMATVGTGVFPGEPGMNLGLVGALGLVGILLAALGRATAGHRAPAPAAGPDPRFGRLGVLAISAILLATSGGFGALLGVLGFTQVRAWARMTVVIAFLAIAGAVLAADRVLARRGLAGGALWGVAGVVAVLGVADSTGAVDLARLEQVEAAWDSDAAFVAGIERQLGEGASVFQLPYVPFPESPPVESMIDYDHLKGFLHSDTLRWSYGGMKGREAEWQAAVAAQATPDLLRDVVAAGFDGLYVDRFGYADRGAQLESEVAAATGTAPQISADGRLAFFDLRAFAEATLGPLAEGERAALRASVIDPVDVEYGEGFHAEEFDGQDTFRWAERTATLRLGNDLDRERRVRLSMGLRTATAASVTVTGPGLEQTVPASPTEGGFEGEVVVPPGGADIHLRTDGPRVAAPADPRELYLRVVDVRVGGEAQ